MGKTQVEELIADKYYKEHNAILTEFMPRILEVYRGDVPLGAVGIRSGSTIPLFLEQYSDVPVEELIKQAREHPINRTRIVEVGNLAVSQKGIGRLLITVLAKCLQQAGYQWMVFTATPEVEKMINRLGYQPQKLIRAQGNRLLSNSEQWGDYYKQLPVVMACNLAQGMLATGSNPFVNKAFIRYRSSIKQISREIQFEGVELLP
jgi:hypothetical protein